MKRLWQLIDREREKEGLTAREMALKLRMDPAQLSRLRTGHIRDLSAESLGNVLAGLDAALHADVLEAYLRDKLGSASARAVPAICEEPAPYSAADPAAAIAAICEASGLNRRVAAALGSLAGSAAGNRRLQALLVSLADYARRE